MKQLQMNWKSTKRDCVSQGMFRTNSWAAVGIVAVLWGSWQAQGQTIATTASATTAPATSSATSPATSYPKMAAVEQYMMERNAEVALARSAGPESLSRDADVLVLGPRGYETAVKGTNGFVCLVLRSWTAGSTDPDFWNPRLRGAACFNAAAARSYLPLMTKRTEMVLAGVPKAQFLESIKSSLEKKELPPVEPGSMCYMLSKDAYVADSVGHWHPHLMFFVPETSETIWGAGLPESPILSTPDSDDHLSVFLIPVRKWSDGTYDYPENKAAGSH
jgi:hypothetical protein